MQSLRETRRQADIAQAAYIATDRPWLEVTGLVVENVEIMPGVGVSATIVVRTKNIGRSPAIGAIEIVEMLVDDRGANLMQQAAPMCQRAVVDKELLRGIEGAMFPDAARETRYLRLLSQTMIARSREHHQQGEGTSNSAISLNRASVAIVGCTTYALPVGTAAGYTAFIYKLARNCGTDTVALPCDFDLDAPATLRGDQIAVSVAPFAGFAR